MVAPDLELDLLVFRQPLPPASHWPATPESPFSADSPPAKLPKARNTLFALEARPVLKARVAGPVNPAGVEGFVRAGGVKTRFRANGRGGFRLIPP